MPNVRTQDVVRRPSRLRALAALEANAESSAHALDRIAATACRVLDAPVAVVNLVGADRQRFVACAGSPELRSREMPTTHGFCPFALGAEQTYAFADAREDRELAANPAVDELGVVAYAGAPLRAADGEPIGTLCTIDTERHEWSHDDLATLSDLAASAVAELQLLAVSRRTAHHAARLGALATLSCGLASSRSADEMVGELVGALEPIGASALWLLVLDESGRAVRARAAGTDPARTARMPLDAQRSLAELGRAGEPDFAATRAEVASRCAPILQVAPDTASGAYLPLTAGDRRIGILGVCFADERSLSADDRAYLVALAGVCSLAVADDRP